MAKTSDYLIDCEAGFNSGFGPLTQVDMPRVFLRVSKDGGSIFDAARCLERSSSDHAIAARSMPANRKAGR